MVAFLHTLHLTSRQSVKSCGQSETGGVTAFTREPYHRPVTTNPFADR
jgi:hypothetical protein